MLFLTHKVQLPDLTSSDCIADLKLRQHIRRHYPGACSLEFQSAMEIVIETLFNWDTKKQKAKGPGIFGTVVAFAPADEEQGRKTLHRHIQIWVKEIDMNLRRDLFQKDEDAKKNFTVSLLDIDTALISYIQNIINPTVIDAGENIKVPIIYGNPEKWYAAKAQGALRDQQGKLQIPLIMVKRTSFSKDEGYQTFNRYLSYPVMTKFNEKNKYDKFNLLNKTVAPTNQIFAVTMPDHIKAEYEFIVWTEYVEQNNAILEKINFAEGDYWGDKQRFNFRVKIDNYTNTIESSGEKDRMVRSTFTLSTNAYLLPESFEDRKQTVQRMLTPKQIKLTSDPDMNTIGFYLEYSIADTGIDDEFKRKLRGVILVTGAFSFKICATSALL